VCESVDERGSVGHALPMGDKPGRYWDLRECAWVKHPAPEPAVVPEQAEPADDQVSSEAEVDVRSR